MAYYYYDVDREKVVTESEIRESYDEEVRIGEIDPKDTTFSRFIELCMTYNNGSLVYFYEHVDRLNEWLADARKHAEADGIEWHQDEIDNLEGELKALAPYIEKGCVDNED